MKQEVMNFKHNQVIPLRTCSGYKHRSVNMRRGLRLVAVVLHNLLEVAFILRDLAGDVDGTHDQLVHVPVQQQPRVLQHGVLKARPDLAAQTWSQKWKIQRN